MVLMESMHPTAKSSLLLCAFMDLGFSSFRLVVHVIFEVFVMEYQFLKRRDRREGKNGGGNVRKLNRPKEKSCGLEREKEQKKGKENEGQRRKNGN